MNIPTPTQSQWRSSLCNLCVLCVSVVNEFRAKTHHRDTENTEVAQRNLSTKTFDAKPREVVLTVFKYDSLLRGKYRYSPSSKSLPSGFLIPNFSRRYCNVRKVRPRSLAALVML
jgi:hypothetical protein